MAEKRVGNRLTGMSTGDTTIYQQEKSYMHFIVLSYPLEGRCPFPAGAARRYGEPARARALGQGGTSGGLWGP